MSVDALTMPNDVVSLKQTITANGKTYTELNNHSYFLGNNVVSRITNNNYGNATAFIPNTVGLSYYMKYRWFGIGDEPVLQSKTYFISQIKFYNGGSGYTITTPFPYYSNGADKLSDTIFDLTGIHKYVANCNLNTRTVNFSYIEFSVSFGGINDNVLSQVQGNYDFDIYWTQSSAGAIADYNYNLGYDAGYETGLLACASASIEDAYAEGYNLGYSAGLNNNNTTSYNTGYSAGLNVGYNNGYTAGLNQVDTASYNNGYYAGLEVSATSSYNEGYDLGYTAGLTAGQSEGYDTGYLDGQDYGEGVGYDTGYNVGYNFGYEEGNNAGYTAGLVSANGFASFLAGITGAVGTVLTFELFPNFTIGTVIMIPLMFGLFWFILKMTGFGGSE